MKRLWVVCLLTVICAVLAQASTVTLTGTLKDEQGSPINGTLYLSLPVPAQDQTSGVAVAPIPVSFRLVNGVITGGAPLYDVANLQPAGLYYVARAYDNSGNLQFYGNYVISGPSPFNLGAAVPTSVTTSNISYSSIVFPLSSTVSFSATPTFTALSGNQLFQMTLTGNITSSTLVMTGISTPAIVTFEFTQDGTGGRTVVFPTNVIGAVPPATGANQLTSQTFIWDGTKAYATGPATANGVPTVNAATWPASSLTAGSNGQCVITSGGTSQWGSCGTGTTISTVRQTGSDFTTTSTTAVTWLTLVNMSANTTYSFDCHGTYQNSIANAGLWQLNGPSSPTAVLFSAELTTSSGASAAWDITPTTSYASAAGNVSASSGANLDFHLYGEVENGANAGNLTIQVFEPSAGTLTIRRGSYCSVRF